MVVSAYLAMGFCCRSRLVSAISGVYLDFGKIRFFHAVLERFVLSMNSAGDFPNPTAAPSMATPSKNQEPHRYVKSALNMSFDHLPWFGPRFQSLSAYTTTLTRGNDRLLSHSNWRGGGKCQFRWHSYFRKSGIFSWFLGAERRPRHKSTAKANESNSFFRTEKWCSTDEHRLIIRSPQGWGRPYSLECSLNWL